MVLAIVLCVLTAVSAFAQGSSNLSVATRPVALASANTAIPGACTILWRNATEIYCMDSVGTNLTQLTPTITAGSLIRFSTLDHVAASPQKGHIAVSYLDSDGYNHLLLYDLAGDTVIPLVPHFQTAGFGGVDWDRNGYIYFAGRDTAPYDLDTAVTAEAQANAAAYDIWRIKYDGTGLQKIYASSTHGEADVAVSQDGTKLVWASTRIVEGYAEIWTATILGRSATLVYQSTDSTRTVHDPELSPDNLKAVFSKRDPDQPDQFGIKPQEIVKCVVANCNATFTQLTAAGAGPISILPDWIGDKILYHELEDDGTPYQGPTIINDDGTGAIRILHGPSAPKWLETDTVAALPPPTTPTDVPPNLLVQLPSFGIHGNAAADAGITTASAYLADHAGKITAITKATNLGSDHHDLTIQWSEVCPTVATCDLTRIGAIASNSTQPLILNIAPIWDDGTKTVPSDIASVDWDSAAMSTAYNGLLTAIQANFPGRVWMIGAGYEVDEYFTANPAQISKYGTFLSSVRTHARTTFGVNPFALTVTFRYAAVSSLLSTYAAIMNQLDYPSITYYPTATADSTVLAAAIESDLQSVQSRLGGGRRWFLAEVGLTSESPSSESLQNVALYVVTTNISHMAAQFRMVGFTWYQLSDVSSAVRTSFGATSYGKRAGIGIRDTDNAAKDIETILAAIFGGVTDTPPPPPPTPQLPLKPIPTAPDDGVTINNPVVFQWSDEESVTFTLKLTPAGGATTSISTAGTAQYVFTGSVGVTYTWTVDACNTAGCVSQDVPPRTVTIAAPPLPPPTNLTISTPTNGATGVSLNPTLAWSAQDASLYRLRFGTVNPPTSEVYSGSVAQFTVSAGSNNTTYYWSIDAINASGSITLSGSFTTEVAAPGAPAHPMLFITAARQTAWDAMKADYDGSATTPKCNDVGYTDNQKLGCDLYLNTVNHAPDGVYNNNGLDPALLSVIDTGNAATHCATAYTVAQSQGLLKINPISSININVVREQAPDYPVIYDLCYSQWDQTKRDTYLAKMNELFTFLTLRTNAPYTWVGFRCADVDQPLGEYMGFMEYYFSTRSYNQTAVDLFNSTAGQQIWGGLTATTLKCFPETKTTAGKTARNMLEYHFDTPSDGGAWLEGSEYSTTAFLGMFGCEALRPIAAANDICDKIDAWVDDHAQFLTHWIARNSSYAQSAGDDEYGHDLWREQMRIHSMKTYLALTGILPDGTTRQNLYRVLHNFRDTNPTKRVPDQSNAARAMIMADPYITASADLSGLDKCYRSPGFGYYLWNDGTLTTDSQFMAHFTPERRGIDHFTTYWGNLGLYRRGQYALTNPVSYAGASSVPEGTNSSLVEGLTPPSFTGRQFKGETGYTCGSDYLYIASTAGGSHFVDSGSASLVASNTYDNTTTMATFQPPALFLHEWTKSVVYLPSATKTYDNIVTIERINAVDPLTTFRGSRWTNMSSSTCYPNCLDQLYQSKKTRIDTRKRWTRYQHQWYDPTVTSNVVSWTLPDGQVVTDTWLAPDAVTITKAATSTLPGWLDSIVRPVEKKWRTSTEPTSDTQWNCLLDVVSARNSGSAAPTLTELTVTNNGAGVLITRTGNDDRVVVANCGQGAAFAQNYPTLSETTTQLSVVRYRGAGSFTFTYTQTTADAKVLLLDLNPALTWTYTVNGGASTPITEDSSGLEELSIATAGAKTIVVTGS